MIDTYFKLVKTGEEFEMSGKVWTKVSEIEAARTIKMSPMDRVRVDRPITFGNLSPGTTINYKGLVCIKLNHSDNEAMVYKGDEISKRGDVIYINPDNYDINVL